MRELGHQVEHDSAVQSSANGVAKRSIGVLTNIVRAMLHDSGLPKFLWAEAFNTMTYVHNRTPTRALDGLTPYEVLHGTKPKIADLPAFGTPCAIVEPAAKLRKLDDRVIMCYIVGYKYSGGDHRVWDPERKVVIESREVVFSEDGLPSPTHHSSPTPCDDDGPAIQQPLEPHTNQRLPTRTSCRSLASLLQREVTLISFFCFIVVLSLYKLPP